MLLNQHLPADGGARLLKVHAHHDEQLLPQPLRRAVRQLARVLEARLGVVDGAGADDDDEVLAQVMDEIGLDVASQMSSAPRGGGQQSGAVTGTAGEAPSVQAMQAM